MKKKQTIHRNILSIQLNPWRAQHTVISLILFTFYVWIMDKLQLGIASKCIYMRVIIIDQFLCLRCVLVWIQIAKQTYICAECASDIDELLFN